MIILVLYIGRMCDPGNPLEQCMFCSAQFKHTDSCTFCGEVISACRVWDHALICPKRKFVCACGQSFQHDDPHHSTCPKVRCACSECSTMVPREELAGHVAVCPQRVACEFRCAFVPHAEIEAHTTAHLADSARYVHAPRAVIGNMESQIDEMMSQLKKMGATQFRQTPAFFATTLPETLRSLLHPHPLTLCVNLRDHKCVACGDQIKPFDGENDMWYLGYRCEKQCCKFDLCIRCALVYPFAVGKRVQRGRHWRWDDQDGGPGQFGTIVAPKPNGWVSVQWDNGYKNNYRIGVDGEFDIKP